MYRYYWYWPERVVLSTPGQITFMENEGGRWESNRGDQNAEEKIKFLAPAGYRIWILQPVSCTEVLETIPVDSEKEGAVRIIHSAKCYIQFEPPSCTSTSPKRVSLWKIIMQ
jgi:hypothetical protein